MLDKHIYAFNTRFCPSFLYLDYFCNLYLSIKQKQTVLNENFSFSEEKMVQTNVSADSSSKL